MLTLLSLHRVPVPGMETHIPVLFLDLSGTSSAPCTVAQSSLSYNWFCLSAADDFQSSLSAPLAGGLDALLSEEDEDDFFDLHIVKHHDSEVRTQVFSFAHPSCPTQNLIELLLMCSR